MMKKLLCILSILLCTAGAAFAQNAITLPLAAQAVADIGNGPVKVRVTQGNASIFTSQGSGVGSTSGLSVALTLTGTPATPPIVGAFISGSGIVTGTTVAAYNGTTGVTLSIAGNVSGGTTVTWGAACPSSAAGIPSQYIRASVMADYYLLYTQARVCAISPGGPVNTLLILPIFYEQTTPGGGGTGGGSVSSVFGRTGVVAAQTGDYSVGQVTNALTNILNSALFYVGSASNVATGVPMSGDCTLTAAGVVICTKTNGVSFAASATTDTTNASNISSGALGTGRLSGSYTGITGVGALVAGSLGAGFTPVPIAQGGTGQATQQAGFEALAPTATIAGSILYWNGSHYVKLDGNASGTKVLQEDATGNPSWASASAGTGTVTGVTLNGTANNITLSGTCNSTTLINCTVDLAAGRKTLPTTQSLTSGTGATYTTPANALWLEIFACAAGAGGMGVTNAGAGSGVAGTSGGTTTFNSVNAVGGTAAPTTGQGGTGGTGGTGSATRRAPGAPGAGTLAANLTLGANGGNGGSSPYCGGGALGPAGNTNSNGVNAGANSGAGGSGATGGGTSFVAGGGGGAGEHFYLLINSPAATYTYTIGAKGTGGAGANETGGDGGAGFIFVIEHYNYLLKRDCAPANDNTPMYLNAVA